jgi:hypothetical protein
MTDWSLGLGRLCSALCRDLRGGGWADGREAARKKIVVADLAKRDLVEIAACAKVLPGTWQVETREGDSAGLAGTWLRPQDETMAPAFGIARADGVIMVRRSRADDERQAGPLVFGMFGSIAAALDAIHNDVAERLSDGRRAAAGVS